MQQLQEFWEEYKFKIVIVGVVVLGLGAFLLFQLRFKEPATQQAVSLSSAQSQSVSSVSESTQQTQSSWLYVDIKGAIHKPGVYKMASADRVTDVIKKAGGPLDEADINQVNLACKLTDQMLIYIPKKGETPQIPSPALISQETTQTTETSQATSVSSTNEATTDTNKINLNSATKEQLQQLTGIGEKKADLIIQYREANGGFKKIEDLKNISGIGDKTFEAISNQITV